MCEEEAAGRMHAAVDAAIGGCGTALIQTLYESRTRRITEGLPPLQQRFRLLPGGIQLQIHATSCLDFQVWNITLIMKLRRCYKVPMNPTTTPCNAFDGGADSVCEKAFEKVCPRLSIPAD